MEAEVLEPRGQALRGLQGAQGAVCQGIQAGSLGLVQLPKAAAAAAQPACGGAAGALGGARGADPPQAALLGQGARQACWGRLCCLWNGAAWRLPRLAS